MGPIFTGGDHTPSKAKVQEVTLAGAVQERGATTSLMLEYRPPFPYEPLIGFLRARGIGGVEAVGEDGVYRRTVRIGEAVGWITVRHAPDKSALRMTASSSLADVLPQVVARVRMLFDTDCDPAAVDAALVDFHGRMPDRCGILGVRMPCSFDGFEMAVRAILGQQITVSAATTLAGRVAAAFGDAYPVDEERARPPFPELTHVFPAPEAFCDEDAPARLGELGVIRTRANAICDMARMIGDGTLHLAPGADPERTMEQLQSIRGIGPWTAQYVAMRALGWHDAFPKEDYGIRQAFPGMKPREIERLSQAWRPYRSYAVMSLWQAPHE